MSFHINESKKETTYLGNDNKTYTPIKKTYRNESAWDVYNQYDKNNNLELDNSEITIFKKDLLNADKNNDKNISEEELKDFAKEKGFNIQTLKQAINFLSAELLLKDITDAFHPGIFNDVNKEECKNLLNKLNKNNFQHFAATNLDSQKGYGENYRWEYNLPSDIFDNYPEKEAKQILLNIINIAKESAKIENINIHDLLQKYNNGIKNNNKNEIIQVTREIFSRFQTQSQLRSAITEYINSPQAPKPELSESLKEDLSNKVKQSGLVVNNDNTGDGKLGNTESKAIGGKSTETILNVLNELLSSCKTKHILESCYKKDKGVSAIYSPRENRYFTTSPKVQMQYNEITKGTIGDGDMSAMVSAIQKWMQMDHFRSTNPEKIKEYILNQFTKFD